MRSNLNLRVVITETNAQMSVCKIPGIGLIDRTGGNPLFHPKHFCHDLKNADNWATVAWLKMKQPDINKGSDLVIAAHREYGGIILEMEIRRIQQLPLLRLKNILLYLNRI